MSPNTVIVHLTHIASAPRLLSVALEMARPAKGHVIGLVILPPLVVLPAGTPGQADPIVIDKQRQHTRDLATAIAPVLATTLAASGCTGEVAVVDAADETPGSVLLDRAMTADLVVVSRYPAGWSRLETSDAPDSLALGCGRPVVVVPDQPASTPFGRRVLLAWDGGREAARALFDALPLLQSADAVHIAWIAPENDPYLAFGLQPSDVAATLGRHGIACEARAVQRPRGMAGRALLEAAAEFRADFLVMGCYGHSRLLEFVLGGVSRHVLEHATIPVLLSH